jgi:hypothetical protein
MSGLWRKRRPSAVNPASIDSQALDLGEGLLGRAKALSRYRETFLVDLISSLVVHFELGALGLAAFQI